MERRIWNEAYDAGVSPEMAFEEVTLTENLDRAAREYGRRPGLIFGNGTMTYAKLKDQVERLATALVRLGVEPGARVARAIEFRSELPKSSVLKILRRELRAEELAKSGD